MKIPEHGLMARYWDMSDRAAIWFFVIAFFAAWAAGGLLLILLTGEPLAFLAGIYVGITWNLLISFYNILHI